MVKIVVEPLSLKRLFKNALPLKAQIECPIKFTQINAEINFVFPSEKISVLGKYSPYYFKELENDVDEYFVAHRKLIDALNYGFRSSFDVTFWTDSKFAHIDGDIYGDRIIIPVLPIKEEMNQSPYHPIMTDEGWMPTVNGKQLSFNVHALVAVEKLLSDLPKPKNENDEIALNWNGEALRMCKMYDNIFRERPLKPMQVTIQGEPITAYFKEKMFRELAKQFSGEFWLGLGNQGMVISCVNSDYALTYLLAAERVEEAK